MIALSLALALRDAGLAWHPAAGDRFTMTAPEMEDEIFHLADMVIEVRQLAAGTIFAFNGTTEWALDSVEQDKTVWLPNETHLRSALGTAFTHLAHRDGSYVVSVILRGTTHSFTEDDIETAYGQALLALLTNT